MDSVLQRIVEERLSSSGVEDEPWALLILAACEGPDSLERVLGGAAISRRKSPAARSGTKTEPPGAYLRSVTVEGFRGIGPSKTLEVTPGPGLTLVIGRNGSGKSSFDEGLEILLTGSNWRWQFRSMVWKDGWRNLHHPKSVSVSAEFAIEGQPGVTRLARTWSDDAELVDGRLSLSLPAKRDGDAASLGWAAALEAYRPFLSYNELGSMFDEGPTKLHDRLSKILGLGDLDYVAQMLRDARLERDKIVTGPKKSLPQLLESLSQADDPRARTAHAALNKRKWDLEAVRKTVTADGATAGGQGDLAVLRALATLETPNPLETRDLAVRLRAAAERADAFADVDAKRIGDLAELLQRAVGFHDRHGDGDCPVCGRTDALDPTWHEKSVARLAELNERTKAWQVIQAEGRTVLVELNAVLVRPPAVLASAQRVGLDTGELTRAWGAVSPPEKSGLREIADHVETKVGLLDKAATSFREKAQAELDRREDIWRPVAVQLAAWLSDAEQAEAAAESVVQLKAAEKWLSDTSADIRQERFAPIADQAIANWTELRQQSSVEVERIALEGTGTKRRVTVDVEVDGVGGAALGVMSQGELHAIALGMFLPRATMPESPFRFVVIDDPVQSMDPARVAGLAQVLARTAKTRQVIVFTHDDRLPESTRRLGIDATIIEVVRHEDSVIDLRESLDPVERNLEDANAIALAKALPSELAHEIVPAFCRSAVEAAAIRVVRKRRIGRGEPHLQVEQLLDNSKTTKVLLALALWDDATRAGEVLGTVSSRWGEDIGDAAGTAIRGTHSGYQGDLGELVRNTRRLCSKIGEIA